jgi:dipeptidyl aminopeptidase/acylaminoacyl peptidase
MIFTFDPEKGLGHEVPEVLQGTAEINLVDWSLSPDGKTLAFTRRSEVHEDTLIHLMSFAGAPERILTVHGWSPTSLDWAADGKSLWATANNTLLNIDLKGKVRPVFCDPSVRLGWAIPSPDGQYLAMWEATGGSNVWMVEQF